MRLLLIPLAAALTLSALGMPSAVSADVANPSAEEDFGWTSMGARYALYGEPSLPTEAFATEFRLGRRLFALPPGSTITQVVEAPVPADRIDAGGVTVFARALLGADAAAIGGTRLSATPLSADGSPLATAATAGPPTNQDRASRTVVVPCGTSLALPARTRQIRVAVDVVGDVGVGSADGLSLTENEPIGSADLRVPSSGRFVDPAQGPGCRRWDPTPLPAPQPPPSPPPPSAGPGNPPPADVLRRMRISSVDVSRRRLVVSLSDAGRVTVTISQRRGSRWQRARRVERPVKDETSSASAHFERAARR